MILQLVTKTLVTLVGGRFVGSEYVTGGIITWSWYGMLALVELKGRGGGGGRTYLRVVRDGMLGVLVTAGRMKCFEKGGGVIVAVVRVKGIL